LGVSSRLISEAPLPTENLVAYNYYLRTEQLTCRAEPASAADTLYEEALALGAEFTHAYGRFARFAANGRLTISWGAHARP